MHTFLHFAENPNNLTELVDMGLAVKNERLAQALQAQAGRGRLRLSPAGNVGLSPRRQKDCLLDTILTTDRRKE